MDSTTLDGLDARPESTLLDTITKAEDAQENKNVSRVTPLKPPHNNY